MVKIVSMLSYIPLLQVDNDRRWNGINAARYGIYGQDQATMPDLGGGPHLHHMVTQVKS